MSIATEITRLQNAKSSIKTAIEGKGVEVPSTTKLDGYGELITSIPSGGDDFYDELKRKSFENCLWIERDSADNEVQWYEGTTLRSSETDSEGAFVGQTTIKKYYTSNVDVSFGPNYGKLASNVHITAIHSLPSYLVAAAKVQSWDGFACRELPTIITPSVAAGFSGMPNLTKLVLGGVITISNTLYNGIRNNPSLTELDLTHAIIHDFAGNGFLSGDTSLSTIKLAFTTILPNYGTWALTNATAWSAASIYESLYTNQDGRTTSNTNLTIKLATAAYNRLTAEQIADINSRGITLTH